MRLKKNVGTTDKLIRVLLAFAIGILGLYKVIDGNLETALLSLAVYILLTALFNISLIYLIFGLNTRK